MHGILPTRSSQYELHQSGPSPLRSTASNVLISTISACNILNFSIFPIARPWTFPFLLLANGMQDMEYAVVYAMRCSVMDSA